MKKAIKTLGIIAIVAVFGFSMAACGDDDGGGNSPKTVRYESADTAGYTYILIITVNGSTAAAGDTYVLTIKKAGQPDKVSNGTVSNADAGTLTLQPQNSGSDPFAVTVSNGQMTAITGAIAVEGAEEPVASPGTLTPVTSGNNNVGTFLNGTWASTNPTRHFVISGNSWVYSESFSEETVEFSKGTWSANKTPAANTTGTITLTVTHVYQGEGLATLPAEYASVKTNTATFTINAEGNQMTISNATLRTDGVWGTLEGTYTKSSDNGDDPTIPIPIEMVQIQAGTFTMGSPTGEANPTTDERPQHQVTLTGFRMGKHPVTQAQYEAVMGTNPSRFKTPVSPETSTANRPVELVSWYDALVFCNKLSANEGLTPAYRISGSTDPTAWGSTNATWNTVEIVAGSTGYRLPTEAQWEYACRAGTTTAYNTWATISDNTGWYRTNSGSRTHSVGEKPANAWGLYDMHGNVWEWCWDWYGTYTSGTQTDPAGAVSGIYRVGRGGTWDGRVYDLRSACRIYDSPGSTDRDSSAGFRLVRP
jgi:formylglycine-generating enzyme required for sulfatase activity